MKKQQITSRQWDELNNLLPPERTTQRGRPAKDNRLVMDAILYRMNTGVAWRDLPEQFGPWQSVYGRLRAWKRQGVWKRVYRVMVANELVDQALVLEEQVR